MESRRSSLEYKKSISPFWPFFGGLAVFVLAVVWAVFGLLNFAPKDPSKYRHDQPVEYYLYVPKAYSGDREWPLFVGIHGAGGSGRDCWSLWQPYADREGFVLLCPTIPGDGGGFYQDVGERTVWSAMLDVQKQYRVSTRAFMTGFSAGAFFVQGFAYHYPQYVSGLSMLSSGVYLNLGPNLRNVPILVVIGDKDDPASVEGSRQFASALIQGGFNIQYELLPGVGHRVTGKGKELTLALFRKTIGK